MRRNGTVAPVVRGNVGGDERFHAVVDRGAGDERRRVHRALYRRAGAGEVERRAPAPHGDGHPDRHGPILVAVVVDPVLTRVDAVGDHADRRPHGGLRLGPVAVEAAEDRWWPIAFEELAETPGPDLDGGVHGAAVALALLPATDVRHDEVEGPRGPLPVEHLDRRDPEALLDGLVRPRHVRPWDGAADVNPVGEVDREGDEPPAREHWPDRFHVGQVVAADLGEVQVPDVSVAELPPRHAPEELLHREGHHAQVDRDVTALGDEPAARVGERARQVARLLEERGARGAHDDEAHLIRDRVDRVAHDLQRDRAQAQTVRHFRVSGKWQAPDHGAITV